MPNITSRYQNEGRFVLDAEVDLSAAAAVVAVRGTNVTCTKTGTGAYQFVFKGTAALKLYEVLFRDAKLNGTPTGAFDARVASVSQATDGSDDITVNVVTLNNAATPAAADVSAACVLDMQLVARVIRMGNPL
jgi:hypothetical protein